MRRDRPPSPLLLLHLRRGRAALVAAAAVAAAAAMLSVLLVEGSDGAAGKDRERRKSSANSRMEKYFGQKMFRQRIERSDAKKEGRRKGVMPDQYFFTTDVFCADLPTKQFFPSGAEGNTLWIHMTTGIVFLKVVLLCELVFKCGGFSSSRQGSSPVKSKKAAATSAKRFVKATLSVVLKFV